jgi:Plasmid pRiA4b ORF-3-like protein
VAAGAAGTVDELDRLRQALVSAGASEEILRMLDGGGTPEEIIGRLVDAGVLPGPDDALADLIEAWTPLLRRGVDPFTAELAGVEFLAALRSAEPDPNRVAEMLPVLVDDAAEHGGPAALAFLRTVAAVGPAPVRAPATQAADRLVADGLRDSPWAKDLGRPKVGACFGYADELGAQEAVTVTFRYGRREHAIAVLMDHDLGGGIKDCWPTDEPEEIRAGYQAFARGHGLQFREYEPDEARAILERALSRPPCPVQPDQIQDVEMYLDLLRSRTALLSDADSTAPRRKVTGRRDTSEGRTVHRLKMSLQGARPPIWRRLEVPSEISLQRLHLVIQAAFGWENYHLWVFETESGRYGTADRELDIRSAASRKLHDVAPRRGDRLVYTYDFGDDWEHVAMVEEIHPAQAGVTYPRCLAGRRAAPPEDCGGIWGYTELLEVLADDTHEDHADRLEWLGLTSAAEFDPARFDLDEINQALSDLPLGRAKP